MRFVFILLIMLFSTYEIQSQAMVNMPDLKGLQKIEDHFFVNGKQTDANVQNWYLNEKGQLLYSCFLNDYKMPRSWSFYKYNDDSDIIFSEDYDISGFILKRWNYRKIEIIKDGNFKIYKTFSSSYGKDLELIGTRVTTLGNISVTEERNEKGASYYSAKFDMFGNIIYEVEEYAPGINRKYYRYNNYYGKGSVLLKVEKILNGRIISVVENIVSDGKIFEKKEYSKNGIYISGEKYTYDAQNHLIKKVNLDESKKEYRTTYWKYDEDFLYEYGEVDQEYERHWVYKKVKSK